MSDRKGAADRSTNASRQERTFVDADGGRWRVYEQAFSDYDRRSGLSLIFSGDSAMRRVRNYPRDWMTLTDAELVKLSWTA
jgi:hypothetical protein